MASRRADDAGSVRNPPTLRNAPSAYHVAKVDTVLAKATTIRICPGIRIAGLLLGSVRRNCAARVRRAISGGLKTSYDQDATGRRPYSANP